MSIEPWKTIEGSQEIVYENPWYKIRRERFTYGSEGKEGVYNVIVVPDSVMVIPVLPDGRIRLLRQYRYIFSTHTIEVVSGSVRHGERIGTPEEAAIRELAEEANLKGDMKCIGKFLPWNAVCSEVSHVFVATNCMPSYAHPDETEEFEFIDVGPEQVDEKIAKGEITDGMTIAAWQMYKLKSV